MSDLDKREQAFEKKFALDEELKFLMTARAVKALGQWAARHLGLGDDEAESYVRRTLETELKPPRHAGLVSKIEDDFRAKNIPVPRAAIAEELERQMETARQKVLEG